MAHLSRAITATLGFALFTAPAFAGERGGGVTDTDSDGVCDLAAAIADADELADPPSAEGLLLICEGPDDCNCWEVLDTVGLAIWITCGPLEDDDNRATE